MASAHNAEASHVAFATFDHKSVKFFWCDKSDVKTAIVPDVERPFCPLPRGKLFKNIVNDKDDIDKIVDRLSNIFSQTPPKASSPGSVSGAAISAAVDSLVGNGGRVIIFTSSPCLLGFGSSKPKDEKLLAQSDKEKSLYLPQTNAYSTLANKCNNERIVVDLFTVANSNFDFPTVSQISYLTGGRAYFYQINNQNQSDFIQKLEKLHFDLSRIITRPNYYDVKIFLRMTLGFEVTEILGEFGKKLGEGFLLAGLDPDFTFAYSLKMTEKPKLDSTCSFQVVALFIDNFNKRYIRSLNLSIPVEPDVGKIYYHVDVDSMTRLFIMNGLNQFYTSSIEKFTIRESLSAKIISFLYFYRKKCSEKSPIQQLILPASVKFIPLFLTSCFKKPALIRNKQGLSSNAVFNSVLKLMREPTSLVIKYLYPKFYKIDDILESQDDKCDDPELVIVR